MSTPSSALKWDKRFLELARHVAEWSKDPSTKVGAVLVRPDRTVASVGYNGFPRGTTDHPHDYADREYKYEKVIHAELNAILNARGDVRGCTLYTWPPGYGPTCSRCAVHVIQAGIARVVAVQAVGEFPDRWRISCERALGWYTEAGVQVSMIDAAELGLAWDAGAR